jgi:DNA-binding NarL/FixJ family response regulator
VGGTTGSRRGCDGTGNRGCWRTARGLADRGSGRPFPYRQASRQTLESHADFEVVSEASGGLQPLDMCRGLAPDLVLMDLVMPVMDGVAATRLIKREYPNTRVLVLTALDESSSFSECIKAGVEGYILPDAPADRSTDDVRAVLAGGSPLDE